MNRKRTYQESMELVTIKPNELISRFRSKKDLYLYMTQQLQLYLPQQHYFNKDFLKQVLKGQKELLSIKDVKFINVPYFEELSVKNLWLEVIQDEDLKRFFPDKSDKGRLPERQFFFNVINTIQPEYLDLLIKHALDMRVKNTEKSQEREVILLTQAWYDKLLKYPQISQTRGRTIHLLKDTTKLLKSRKPKEKKQLITSLKRFKEEEKSQQNIFVQNKEIQESDESNINMNTIGQQKDDKMMFQI